MTNPKRPVTIKKPTDDKKLRYAIDFIEELTWFFESRKRLDFSEIPEILREKILYSPTQDQPAGQYASENPHIHYLIGVLPRLFQDEKLFGKNDEIADFARDVLGIEISRVEKRSKYELIGLIVCETNSLNDEKLKGMVKSLSNIAGNNKKLAMIAEEKSTDGFSWNQAIRKLANQNDS